MSETLQKIHPKYLVDEAGEKTHVLLSIEEFEGLMEDLEDIATIEKRLMEPSVSLEQLKSSIRTGKLR